VISVDVVERNAHVAPGRGIRNRTQRLAEYAQRRVDVLGLPPPPSPPLFDTTNTPKRRRLNVDFTEMKRAGLSELTSIAEEAKKMRAMTISFGVPDRGKSKIGVGFKYDAQVVQSVLFPHLHQGSIVEPPPPKRRKISTGQKGQSEGDVETDTADESRQGIVLESSKETYLVTWDARTDKARYTLSMLGPPERPAKTPLAKPSQSPPTDAALNAQDTTKAAPSEPSEGVKMSVDDRPPLTDLPKPDVPPEKEGETDASSKASSIPPSAATPNPTMRVLRLNISDGDFAFEKDTITVRGSQHHMDDDGKMIVEGDEANRSETIEMRVLRWRWYVKP